MKKIVSGLWKHKIISLIVLTAVIGGGYFLYQNNQSATAETRYLTQAAQTGTLISSISGSGQVSASNQVDLKPKVSGTIVSVAVKNGQEVKEGDVIVQLDSRDAAQKVTEARLALDNAKLDLEDLLAPTDALTLLQAQNALSDAQESLEKLKKTQQDDYADTQDSLAKAQDALNKTYEDAYNDLANVFLNLPDTVNDLYTTFYSKEIASTESSAGNVINKDALENIFITANSVDRDVFLSFSRTAVSAYNAAKSNYDAVAETYKNTNRQSSSDTIEALLNDTISTIKIVSDAIKAQTNLLENWSSYRTQRNLSVYSKVTSYQSALASDTSQINGYLSTLLAHQRSLQDDKETISNALKTLTDMEKDNPIDIAQAERGIEEKKQKLTDLQEGPTELDIKNKQLTVQQRTSDLVTAQQNLADTTLRAPFAGVIVSVDAAKGDEASTGTTIASIITPQKIATITLNEIDTAKVVVGQKATLSFDAIPDLSLTGSVAELDTVGSATQGVVSYDATIAFDVQDERIKPGMSVSVDIIIESKPNVLLISLSAVKTSGDKSYVEILVNNEPQTKTIETGSSNDTEVEIVSGLSEGDEVITQTISGTTTTQSSSSEKSSDGPGGMGGMMMIR
jgi:multidrug efflux pump subunit AcrA (membrane-fusion protein)